MPAKAAKKTPQKAPQKSPQKSTAKAPKTPKSAANGNKPKAKKSGFHSLERKSGLYLKMTPDKFRGVFCKTAIKKGEEIESTPTIVLNEKETAHMEETIMRDYVFTLDKLTKPMLQRSQVKNHKNGSTIIMGVATYCNHDEKPNAQLLWEERDGTLYHTLVATRDIPANTEICTSYGKGWFDDREHMSN